MVELLYVNQGLLEEFDKEENVEVTRSAVTSCLKRRKKNVLSNVTYWPSQRLTGARFSFISFIYFTFHCPYTDVELVIINKASVHSA
jgi:hypothetical protein